MTGWKLFKIRFMDDMKYQGKVLHTVIDWTVWIYLFVPVVILGGMFYVDVWKYTDSYWLEPLPEQFLLYLLFLPAAAGKFRSFTLEADQLFLLDRTRLYQSLRRVVFSYSLLQMIAATIFLMVLFLPWLVHLLGLRANGLLFLFVFLLAFRMLQATWQRVVYHRVGRLLLWFSFAIVGLILIHYLPLSILAFIGVVLIVLLSVWHTLYLVPAKRYFFEEVSEEHKERVRYAKFILGVATDVEKAPIRFGKRPFFLRRSQQLFRKCSPENGLLELLLKGFVRHSVYVQSYLRSVGTTVFAVVVVPVSLKWLVFLLFVAFLNYNSWLKGLYEKLLDQHFFECVPIHEEIREKVWLRFKRLLMIPALSIVGLMTIVLTFLSF